MQPNQRIMVELKDATLTLGDRRLFENLSLMAQDGQLTCITGAEGTGKTAVIRVMLGFQPLDEGLVSVDGELLTPLSAPTFRKLMRREILCPTRKVVSRQ